MNPDTAELAILENSGELAAPLGAPADALQRPGYPGRWLARLRADPARMAAMRDSWRALWGSRLLVWSAGVGAVLAFGFGPVRHAFNPPGVTRGFGWLGNLLAAPAARWDAAWYLVIAHYGYRPDLGAFTSSRTAFFPLYPLGVGALFFSYAAAVILILMYMAYCNFENKRRDHLDVSAGERIHIDTDFKDLTDQENVHFRYVW